MSSDNIVRLLFNTQSTGSGFSDVSKGAASAQKSLESLKQGIGFVGSAVGGVGSQFSRVATMLLSGGIWGAAISAATMGISKLFNALEGMKAKNDEVTRSFREQIKYLRSAEHAAEGYRKRVEEWKRAKSESDKAEEDAAKAKIEALEKEKQIERERMAFEEQYYALEKQIAEEESKVALADADELTVLKSKIELMRKMADSDVSVAKGKLSSAHATGGGYAADLAERELRLAEARRKSVDVEARKLVDAYKKKKESEEAAAAKKKEEEEKEREQLESARKRKEIEEKALRIREEGEKRIKELESQIAEAKSEAARLEENAARARGVGFGDWARGERDRAKEERTEARRQANRERSVQAEINNLEKMNPRTMTKWQKSRLSKLREWQADQDPNNNPMLKQADRLQAKRDKLEDDMLKELKDIKAALKDATTL